MRSVAQPELFILLMFCTTETVLCSEVATSHSESRAPAATAPEPSTSVKFKIRSTSESGMIVPVHAHFNCVIEDTVAGT